MAEDQGVQSSASSSPARGVGLCLASSLGFGAMAILAKDAYAAGAGVMTLVALRLVIAAPCLWLAAAITSGPARLGAALRTERRTAATVLLVGAGPFAAQALMFFSAVERLDAAVAELLVFTYPALVLLGAAALRRAPMRAQTWAVLALALSGAALVLLGAGAGPMDGAGVALALGAAVGYASYILAIDGVAERLGGVLVAALMTTGGALALGAVAAGSGSLDLALPARAWVLLATLGVICTAGPLVALYAGMARVGAPTASVLSLVEPVVTVVLAAAVLGERLEPAQVLGGLLVLGAVGLVLAGATSARMRPWRKRSTSRSRTATQSSPAPEFIPASA